MKPSVLVCDDDPISRAALAEVLADVAEVTQASTGREALAQALRERPDLLLLDVRMPDLDGVVVCERLKADPRTRAIPVVFVTAATDEIDEARGLLAGAVEYVSKPIRPALVVARVRNLLELKRARDQVALDTRRDEVTGLGNRRALEEALAVEWQRAARREGTLSVAMVEIDGLHAYEELYGAATAADCLREIGDTLAAVPRQPEDLVARFSPERFAVLLPETDAVGAVAVAERLRTAVSGRRLPGASGNSGLTVSVGVATAHPASAPAPAELVVHALARLEHAVRLGGNRFETGPDDAPAPAERRAAAKATLFVVDDDSTCIESLSQLALAAGYEVEFARDGHEALRLIEQSRPDLVLLDVEMPGPSGFEVCGRLKASSATSGIPVIFLSALSDPAEKVRAFAVGGADYVGKPFHPGEVLARVAHQIKITRLQREMRAAHGRLVELDRLKATFAAMLVHDIRSPLTVVHSTIAMLQGHDFGRDADLAEMVAMSGKAVRDALELISEVLEVYRSEQGASVMETAPVDATAVLKSCVGSARIEAARRTITLDSRLDGPMIVQGNGRRLERAIGNLVDNALKFTPRGGRVSVEVQLVPLPVGPTVRIEVRDTGAGIPEPDLPHIFELYRQADSPRRAGGFGLGLAIVKRIVDAHGGRIEARSQAGVGTAFTIDLPALSRPS